MKRKYLLAASLAMAGLLVLPGAAGADTLEAAVQRCAAAVGGDQLDVGASSPRCLVMFMQAGFAFLEIGFSRGKNAGTIVAKILINFSIAALAFYACGFAFAFGTGEIIGDTGFFLQGFGDPLTAFPVMGLSDATVEAKWFFQFVFCAVSLAIVWGTTLERIKFGVYVIFAVIFAALIYPIGAHWVFGGGWLQTNIGMQDFAGSTAVHLIGATAGLAVLLLLGARRGKYGEDGKPRAIPGHSMPLFGLGVLILWLGWFGFNPGSTLGALDGRFTEVLMVTELAAAAGVLTAAITSRLLQRTLDIGMIGNGAIAALVAITAPSGYVEAVGRADHRRSRRRAGGRRRPGDRQGARRPGRRALRARPGRYLGNTVVRAVHLAAPGPVQRVRRPGGRPVLLGLAPAAGRPGAGHHGGVRVRPLREPRGRSTLIKLTYGLRVTPEEEDAGLDISEHGMYGYPEQFIPNEEYPGGGAGWGPAPAIAPRAAPVTQMTGEARSSPIAGDSPSQA